MRKVVGLIISTLLFSIMLNCSYCIKPQVVVKDNLPCSFMNIAEWCVEKGTKNENGEYIFKVNIIDRNKQEVRIAFFYIERESVGFVFPYPRNVAVLYIIASQEYIIVNLNTKRDRNISEREACTLAISIIDLISQSKSK